MSDDIYEYEPTDEELMTFLLDKNGYGNYDYLNTKYQQENIIKQVKVEKSYSLNCYYMNSLSNHYKQIAHSLPYPLLQSIRTKMIKEQNINPNRLKIERI